MGDMFTTLGLRLNGRLGHWCYRLGCYLVEREVERMKRK
jgi:hypothetical protein